MPSVRPSLHGQWYSTHIISPHSIHPSPAMGGKSFLPSLPSLLLVPARGTMLHSNRVLGRAPPFPPPLSSSRHSRNPACAHSHSLSHSSRLSSQPPPPLRSSPRLGRLQAPLDPSSSSLFALPGLLAAPGIPLLPAPVYIVLRSRTSPREALARFPNLLSLHRPVHQLSLHYQFLLQVSPSCQARSPSLPLFLIASCVLRNPL